MRILHGAALAIGIALFAWLLLDVGPQKLWHDAAALGWGVLAVIAVEGVADWLHTCAWQRCFSGAHRPSVLSLWWPHLAGGAINFVTPTATLGGEVVRGALVPPDVPGAEATASIAVNKLAATLSDVLLSLAGVGLLVVAVDLPAEVHVAVGVALGLFAAAVAGFLVAQRRGRLASYLGERRGLQRLLGAERAERFAAVAADVDTRIAAFHADTPGDLAASIALHALGSSVGAAQLALFLWLLGVPVGLFTVSLVFLVARVIDLAAFLIPARLGVQEGSRMFAMRLAGLDPALGLLFSLVLRLEQIVFAALGLAAYFALASARARRRAPVAS